MDGLIYARARKKIRNLWVQPVVCMRVSTVRYLPFHFWISESHLQVNVIDWLQKITKIPSGRLKHFIIAKIGEKSHKAFAKEIHKIIKRFATEWKRIKRKRERRRRRKKADRKSEKLSSFCHVYGKVSSVLLLPFMGPQLRSLMVPKWQPT